MSGWGAQQYISFLFGIVSLVGVLWLGRILFLSLIIEVEDETAVLVTRFGKLQKVFREPGPVLFLAKWIPGFQATHVSLQRDFRHFQNVTINDRRGTSVLIDLWVEVRIQDPVLALFAVEDWEESLRSMLTHLATSVLSPCEFSAILVDRLTLGDKIRQGAKATCDAWGLSLEVVQLRKISLLPEVSRQMFDAVGARLEMAKAEVEEEGRIRIQMLEATTAAKVAELVAEAKSQHLAAVGRAYAALAATPEVLKAYTELYELSLASTERLVSFQGFERGEIKPLDAAMAVGPAVDRDGPEIPRPIAPN